MSDIREFETAGRPSSLLLILLLPFLTSCFPERDSKGHQEAAANVQLRLPGAHLPSSARNLWYWEGNWQEHGQCMRFDTLSTEAHAFATEIFGHDVVVGKKVAFGVPRLPWWTTSFPPDAAGESVFTDGVAREMMIAARDQTSARVWLCLSNI